MVPSARIVSVRDGIHHWDHVERSGARRPEFGSGCDDCSIPRGPTPHGAGSARAEKSGVLCDVLRLADPETDRLFLGRGPDDDDTDADYWTWPGVRPALGERRLSFALRIFH